MKELQDIVAAYDKAVQQHKRTALATVVMVEGSSYRRPGARMLVTEEGLITGAISGGCLEGDALRKAQLAIFQQQNRLEIYDTSSDEEHLLGVQLGCNGIVYILFEPIDPADPANPLELLKKLSRHRQAAVLVTVFNRAKTALQYGTRSLWFAEKSQGMQRSEIEAEAQNALELQASLIRENDENCMLFQFVPPAIQLVIFGAGNDAQPLVDMAAVLGWQIVVTDGRPAYCTAARFPKANRVQVRKAEHILSSFQLDAHTAVVLMTHNYQYDLVALEQLIGTPCPYIGLLGPKQKLHKMLEELAAKGTEPDAEQLSRIYGPVGLDLGAEHAEEIALSILAEIKAVFSRRNGRFLRDRPAQIHERFRHLEHV